MNSRNYKAIESAIKSSKSAGFAHGAAMRKEIIKESGVSRATFYRYLEIHPELRIFLDGQPSHSIQELSKFPHFSESSEVKDLKLQVVSLHKALEYLQAEKYSAVRIRDMYSAVLWANNKKLKEELYNLRERLAENNVSKLR